MRTARPLVLPHGLPLGAASRWWLAQSLRALDASLKRLGQILVLRRGTAADMIPAVAKEANAASVNWIASDIAGHAAIEREVAHALGTYVSKWVPELARLAAKLIHHPWDAIPMELAAAGVVLGITDPEPIVDHKAARARALAAFATTRAG
jgi:deoxyribodipyrimidine photolyase